jgi:hypothetical protein
MGAGPPHTVKRPEIVMKRTHQHEPPDSPALLGTIKCPRCHQPWRAGHDCPQDAGQ